MVKTFDYEHTHINKIVTEVLNDAVEMKANNIYIEPLDEHLIVNFNINNKLVEYATIPNSLKRLLYARIKVIFALDITELKSEQHGKLYANFKNKNIDFDVLFVSTSSDQKIIISILN